MAKGDIFVGREAELEQFGKVLEDPKGQAVLVVGQVEMGKTWLVNRMAALAEEHPELKCGWVRYEVTPNDMPDSTMALMMDNAFEAAQVEAGSFDGTAQRTKQWRALLNIIKIGDLVFSLKRDPARNTREQFLGSLRLISKRMPGNGRAIFIIDPEKYMRKDSDQDWAIVVKQLPEKIKMVFAQRPEDVLVDSETLGALDNVVRVPEKRIGVLEEEAVDELLDRRSGNLDCSLTELRRVINKFGGHPYAIQAALDLLEAGTPLTKLPGDPTPARIARMQRKKVCSYGQDVISLFEAYAILEVAVPDEVVEAVSGTEALVLERVLEDSYLGALLREETGGRRIYHTILADRFAEKIKTKRGKKYHRKAIEVYRGRLKGDIKPDGLSAIRLPEHILAVEGTQGFVSGLLTECADALMTLGLLETGISLARRALDMVGERSLEEAGVKEQLGVFHNIGGNVDKAEKMFLESLAIAEGKGELAQTGTLYGNLGIICQKRGDLREAEEYHRRALGSAKQAGLVALVGTSCGELGIIYEEQNKLDEAETMLLRSLEVFEQISDVKGVGGTYLNIGNVYAKDGKWGKAEQMYLKSLQVAKEIGYEHGISSCYANLGLVYMEQGDLDKAEKMHKKSLEIAEKMGFRDGVATDYSNLGDVYKKRGDIEKAREYWGKAVELFKKNGIQPEVEKTQRLLDGLSEKGEKR